jgi:phage terminase large subunit-like protein
VDPVLLPPPLEHTLNAAPSPGPLLAAQISSIEEADAKMEELAKAGKIDPAFLQITAKAYGAARDTNMTLDEAKWVAYRLYVRARDYFERKQPVEKRILEYLVSIRDPAERTKQLDAAITPGPMRYTDTHDYMWSTPQRLFVVLDGTLKAFDSMQAAAAQRMAANERTTTPWKVKAMRELRDEIMRRYL